MSLTLLPQPVQDWLNKTWEGSTPFERDEIVKDFKNKASLNKFKKMLENPRSVDSNEVRLWLIANFDEFVTVMSTIPLTNEPDDPCGSHRRAMNHIVEVHRQIAEAERGCSCANPRH